MPQDYPLLRSIREPVELAIGAGAMPKGGEVLLPDFGDPARIDDLARLMVRLMGLKVLEAAMRMRDIESIQAVLMRAVEDYAARTHATQGEGWTHAAGAPPSWTVN